MGNLSCGNLDPPPSSGGQSAASSPSALHEDGLTKRFRRCRSPFREPPKSDRHPVGIVIAIISESRSASVRNRDRHHLGTLIAIARNTQIVRSSKKTSLTSTADRSCASSSGSRRPKRNRWLAVPMFAEEVSRDAPTLAAAPDRATQSRSAEQLWLCPTSLHRFSCAVADGGALLAASRKPST